MLIKKIKHTISSLTGFIQYHYACTRNHYKCKLIGEKREPDNNNAIIIFRNLGDLNSIETPIKELLATPNLIANFHPKEALRIGSIALEEFILELPKKSRKQQFHNMKNIMLNSIHDISCNNSDLFFHESFLKIIKQPEVNSLSTNNSTKNKYPFRLVGGKFNKQMTNTIITYTILGKRDGHEKNLHELIYNEELLEKFHPTEAVKFGFIASGDSIFNNHL